MPEGDGTIDRLTRANQALNEQVKLLVRTEQRLYRSQFAQDRQISRIRGLAQFALGCASVESSDTIFEKATELLHESFHLDQATALLSPAGPSRPGGSGLPLIQRTDLTGFEVSCAQPRVLDRDEIHPGLARALEQHGVPVDDIGTLVSVPIHSEGAELEGLILAWRDASTRDSFHRESLTADHVPFLGLVASHIEGALRNAALRSQLAASNRHLSASLDELERTQQRLVQARKMEAIGGLAGGIAHDFNNLLTVILNHSEILARSLDRGTTEHEHVSRITDASDQAAKITRQLLAFSRMEPHAPRPLDLGKMVRDRAHVLEQLLGASIELRLELAPDAESSHGPGLGTVLVDHSQAEQVLLNLVVNARDAMPDGGQLRIALRPAGPEDRSVTTETFDPGDYVALSVADTGVGMDDATLAQIFEPFFTTKSMGQGTGLGLATVYGAVGQNRGFIDVVSQPGRGSSFTVLLPRSREGAEFGESLDPVEGGSGNATILLVEDDEFVRNVTVLLLEGNGYRVSSAEDVATALELGQVLGSSIDLLLTDVVLPDGRGPDIARKLQEERPDLPVLFVSGYPTSDFSHPELGSRDAFLQKPYSHATLLAAVQRALDSVVTQ